MTLLAVGFVVLLGISFALVTIARSGKGPDI